MTVQKPQNVTLIDTLGDGYRAVHRRPWLLVIPIFINLYFWFGTPLSFAPLIDDWRSAMQTVQQSQGTPFGTSLLPGYTADLQQESNAEAGAASMLDMRQPLAIYNYVPLTVYVMSASGTFGSGLGVPLVHGAPQLLDGQQSVIQVQNLAGAIAAFVLLNTVLLGASAVFLTLVAEAVRGERLGAAVWLRRLGHASLSILGYAALLTGVALLAGLPSLFVVMILFAVSPLLGAFAALLLLIAWFWGSIYFGFALEAIVVSGVGPVRALHASINIVRRNFWNTLLFLFMLMVIAVGSGVIWQMLAATATTAGLLVAIVGSAYICCGLVAARVVFYRERLRRWQLAASRVQGEARASSRQQ